MSYGLSVRELELLNNLRDNVARQDREWLREWDIDVKEYDNFWVLNYNQFTPANEVNVLARALILTKHGDLVSMSFKRFGNVGEGYTAPVDFARCDVLEKLDGSMVGVCFPYGEVGRPLWHTRRMLSTHSEGVAVADFSGGEETFLIKEIGEYLRHIPFTRDDIDKTWVFEFINKERPVVTSYTKDRFGLHLIGLRDLGTLEEWSETELDDIARRKGLLRPRRWGPQSDYASIQKMMDEFPDDFEGFVLRDQLTGERAKAKKKAYLERHRIIGRTNYRNLIPLWKAGDTEEIIVYFPATKVKFAEIQRHFDRRVGELTKLALTYTCRYGERKALALAMEADGVPKVERGYVFACYGAAPDQLGQLIADKVRAAQPDYIKELLGLED